MQRFFASLCFFIFLFSPLAQAAERNGADGAHVQVTITPEMTHVASGQTIYVAIEQTLEDGWHSYWVNPGDSGLAMSVKWRLPEGFEAGAMKWPTPEKIVLQDDQGDIVSYGYHDRVTILQEITAPFDLPEGPLTWEADIDILICKEVCIPVHNEVTLILNEGTVIDNSAVIDGAFQNLPAPFHRDVFFSKEVNSEGEQDFVLNFIARRNFFSPFVRQNPDFEFFPYEWGVVNNGGVSEATFQGETLTLRQVRGDRPLEAFQNMRGVIAYKNAQGTREALEITAVAQDFVMPKSAVSPANSPESKSTNEKKGISLIQALIFALLGGIILNLMPCVFPILSMKALALCKLSDKENRVARLHGLEYTAGVLVSFAAIAGLLIALKSAGAQIGWGFHLQSPFVVVFLAYLLFVIGLNLSGLFEIKGGFTSLGSRLTKNARWGGSFFTGVLATLVAAPCTAPFMGVALGFALTQPWGVAVAVFLALGLGLALPYLLLSFMPSLRAFLPKPGAWMDRFKQLLAFPMYASTIWLIWVLGQQWGLHGVLNGLSGLLALSFAIWLLQDLPVGGVRRGLVLFLACGAVMLALFFGFSACNDCQLNAEQENSSILSFQDRDFSPERLEQLLAGDRPVFVNMTASWCITCKINERVALNASSVKSLFDAQGVIYLKGDWTNRNAEITAYLTAFNRQGVPLYVYYGVRDPQTGMRPEPYILPQILTPSLLRKVLSKNS